MVELTLKVRGCELGHEAILQTQGLTATGFAAILSAIMIQIGCIT